MSHIRFVLLLTSFFCLFSQCKESEEDKLPPATKVGANTFGCLMNGKAWPINRGGFIVNYINYSNGLLNIAYYVKDDLFSTGFRESVHLTTKKIRVPGSYVILYNDLNSGLFSASYNEKSYFSSDMTNIYGYAVVNISRLDTANKVKVISGTFNFTLLDETGTSKLKITKGRFDLAFL